MHATIYAIGFAWLGWALVGAAACGGSIERASDPPPADDGGFLDQTSLGLPPDGGGASDALGSTDARDDTEALADAVARADAPDPNAACAAGLSLCGISCVDVQIDGDNCGRCTHGCQGGTCKAGQCQAVSVVDSPAAGFSAGYDLAIDQTNLYWTDGATIWTIPKRGGAMLAFATVAAGAIAVDSTDVYATTVTTNGMQQSVGSVMALPKGGDAGVPLLSAPVACCGSGPSEIAMDDTNVYFSFGRNVMTVSKRGGTPVALVTPAAPQDIAVGATSVYWTEYGGDVMTVPKGGGVAVTLAPSPYTSRSAPHLAVDSTNVYWYSYVPEIVYSATLAGGTAFALSSAAGLLPTGYLSSAGGIVTDSDNVYWLGNDSVMTVSKSGGTAATLASGQPVALVGGGLAVDATAVYWLTSRTLMKLAK